MGTCEDIALEGYRAGGYVHAYDIMRAAMSHEALLSLADQPDQESRDE